MARSWSLAAVTLLVAGLLGVTPIPEARAAYLGYLDVEIDFPFSAETVPLSAAWDGNRIVGFIGKNGANPGGYVLFNPATGQVEYDQRPTGNGASLGRVVEAEGAVFIFQGGGGSGGGTRVFRYDADSGAEEEVAEDLKAIYGNFYGMALAYDGDRIHIFGGRNNAGSLYDVTDIYTYDPVTDELELSPTSLPSAVVHGQAFYDEEGGDFYIVRPSNPPAIIRYDPAAATATTVAYLPNIDEFKVFAGYLLWDGQHAYVMTGKVPNSAGAIHVSRFDPDTNQVDTLTGTLVPPLWSSAYAYDGEALYVLGGSSNAGGVYTEKRVLRFQPGVPAAPTNLEAEATGALGRVDLTWTAPALESGESVGYYSVRRSVTPGGPYDEVGISQDAEHQDTGAENRAYYYVVHAVNDLGVSLPSNEASASAINAVGSIAGPLDDQDLDGLNDTEEDAFGTSKLTADSDGDGLCDGGFAPACYIEGVPGSPGEVDGGLILLHGTEWVTVSSHPKDPDTDDDGLNDYREHVQGTHPGVIDSDRDSLSDFAESVWWGSRNAAFCEPDSAECRFPNPTFRDLYVEVDWFLSTQPPLSIFDRAMEHFETDSSAHNPITLHVDYGQFGGGGEAFSDDGIMGLGEVDRSHMGASRQDFFHYAVVACYEPGDENNFFNPRGGDGNPSGLNLILYKCAADQYAAAVSAFCAPLGILGPVALECIEEVETNYRRYYMLGVFMHELGHNMFGGRYVEDAAGWDSGCLGEIAMYGNPLLPFWVDRIDGDDQDCNNDGLPDNFWHVNDDVPEVMSYRKTKVTTHSPAVWDAARLDWQIGGGGAVPMHGHSFTIDFAAMVSAEEAWERRHGIVDSFSEGKDV